MPERIQRRRTKGWRMPPNTVYVGRGSKWGNEFAVGDDLEVNLGGSPLKFKVMDRAHAVNLFRIWQVDSLKHAAAKELAGKNLACWCPLDQPCHADVLLELANRDTPSAG